jgi:chemotaxis protein MotB
MIVGRMTDARAADRKGSSGHDAAPPRRSSALRAWLLATLGFTGCGALGFYYWELHQAHRAQQDALVQAQSSASTCTAALETAQASASTCETERTACDTARVDEAKKAQALTRVQSKMESDLEATARELESLRKLEVEAEKGAAAFAELKQQLKEMIDSQQVEVQRRDGRLIVQLPAEVLFASGSADLSEDGKVALIKLSAVLERMPDRKFMIAGHTDALQPAKGSRFRNNWELSTARAVTVTELLVTAKLPATSLVASGYGEFAPIADNRTETGRTKNRRIEIVLLPDIDELTVLEEEPPAAAAAAG